MNAEQTYISEKVRNSSNVVINPATEDKQDTIIGHVDGIEGQLTTLNDNNFSTEAKQDDTIEILDKMLIVLEAKLKSLGVVTSGTNRLSIDVNSGTIGTVSTVTTCSTVSNLAQIGGVGAWTMVKAQSNLTWNNHISNL